jgi:radical SAM superfamily enzyme YgiQ (UPF0313 family)
MTAWPHSAPTSIALILPPVQSFFMPYSAPAVLAARLKEQHGARTLVVDCGIDWLMSEMQKSPDASNAFAALRLPASYRDLTTISRAYFDAEQALETICAPWLPEQVELSGRYHPPMSFQTWETLRDAANSAQPTIFDRYYADILLPQLSAFDPDIVALSVPFDWMLFPTVRLASLLRQRLHRAQIATGGHAISRMWHERHKEFFDMLMAHWVAGPDGELAMDHLVKYVLEGSEPPPNGLLLRLPTGELPPRQRSADKPALLTSELAPDYSDLSLSSYLRPQPILPVPTSDGCFFGGCRFCSRQRTDQSVPYVERPARQVAATMKELAKRHGGHEFILAEDIVSHRFMLDLARQLEGTGLTWFCEATFKAGMVRRLTDEDCRLLFRGGCRLILNGLESGSARIRDSMGCPVDIDEYERNLSRLVDAGIVPYVTMIFGYPGETVNDLRESVAVMKRHVHHAVFSSSRFWVVPGTSLSEELLEKPGTSCVRRGVLDGGLEFSAVDTVGAAEADRILREELSGLFGPFPQFVRSIPVLMQLLSKLDVTRVGSDGGSAFGNEERERNDQQSIHSRFGARGQRQKRGS